MKKRITGELLKTLQPGDTVWDTGLTGFGVRCRDGGLFYVAKYQRRRQQRWIRIGQHGTGARQISLRSARKEAMRLLSQVSRGGDPAAVRDVPTLEQFAARYQAERAPDLKPTTRRLNKCSLDNQLLPALGRHRLDEISTSDVLAMRRADEDRPGAFNNARKLLRRMLTAAMAWGVMPKRPNPCDDVPAIRLRPRQRFLSEQEIADAGAAIASLAAEGGRGALAAAAIRLLIFTGARRQEITKLRWQQVRLSEGVIVLEESKTGALGVPLNPPAQLVLSKLRKRAQLAGDLPELVFDLPMYYYVYRRWTEVRKAAGLDGVRLHDLRHSFASVAVGGGHSLYITGALLGHRRAATTQRYAHLSVDPLRAASTDVGKRISRAMQLGVSNARKKRRRRD